jgi:hypothetical protein
MEEWWQSVEALPSGLAVAQDRTEQAVVQTGATSKPIARQKTVSFLTILISYYPTPGDVAGQF